jgi:hypothetical protein
MVGWILTISLFKVVVQLLWPKPLAVEPMLLLYLEVPAEEDLEDEEGLPEEDLQEEEDIKYLDNS